MSLYFTRTLPPTPEVQQRIDGIARAGEAQPLDTDRILEVVDNLTDEQAAALKGRLEDPIHYSQMVERAARGNGVAALFRLARSDGQLKTFLGLWDGEEQEHANGYAALCHRLGLEVLPDDYHADVPWTNKALGALGVGSAFFSGSLETAYYVFGRLHERLAIANYARQAEIMDGELSLPALANALPKPVRKQESRHFGYYGTAFEHLWGLLRPRQQSFVRWLVSHAYAPVGAGADEDKPEFSRTVQALEQNDPKGLDMARVIQGLVDAMMELQHEDDPDKVLPFVLASFRKCRLADKAEQITQQGLAA